MKPNMFIGFLRVLFNMLLSFSLFSICLPVLWLFSNLSWHESFVRIENVFLRLSFDEKN